MAYFQEHQESIERTGVNTDLLIFYCKHKLGRLPELAYRSDFDYKERQIVEYQESDFFYQMQNKYTAKSEGQQESQNEYSRFNSTFPFEVIYAEVKRTIKDLKLLPGQEAKRIN